VRNTTLELLLFYAGLLALGGSVGLISNALGLGGGVFMVPAFLECIEGMDAKTAKGSSLFIIVFVAATNAWRLNRSGKDWQWRLVAVLATGSVTGAYLSSWVTSRPYVSQAAVVWTFVGFLVLAGVRTFLIEPRRVPENAVRERILGALLVGLATGIVSGATGIGGGAVLVPLALLMGIVSNERVVALSNTVMVATCATAALCHGLAERTTELPWTFGQVDVMLAPLVVIGALIAGPAGRWLNARMSLRWRKGVMGAVLLLIAARLAYRALGS
jgi:uncharacterized protein